MHSWARLTTVAVFCAGSSFGCSARQVEPPSAYSVCDRTVDRTPQGVLRVCGQLNAQTVAAVQQAIEPTDSEIVITSGGGPSSDGMAFARLVRARGLAVRVRRFCLSACATYVLMGAKQVVVEPGAVVAFHHTASFAINFTADRAGATTNDPSRGGATAERNFYSEIGLDPDLLYRFASAVEPVCTGIRQTPGGPTARERYVNYRYGWFVPTPEEAEALFPSRLTGAWPASREEAEASLRLITGNPTLQIRYGWPSNLQFEPGWYAQRLPVCQGSA